MRGSNAATEEALASYDETVLRALEETESSLSNYHAQQARLIKLNDQARESERADIPVCAIAKEWSIF